jgi:hypothetical protein
MPSSTPGTSTPRRARRIRTALTPQPANVITLALALVLGGAGGAAAANGGNFLLGKANTETATASLANTNGSPLKLTAPFGDPPLTVNKTDAVVPNLDAQFAGGFTGNQMANFGGDGFTAPGTSTGIDQAGELITQTGFLPAGTYYVTATAALSLNAGTSELGICWIAKGSDNTHAQIERGSMGFQGNPVDTAQDGSVVETVAVKVNTNDSLQQWCVAGPSGGVVDDAGITAIRIAFPLGDPPARSGTPLSRTHQTPPATPTARPAPAHKPPASPPPKAPQKHTQRAP